MTLPEFTTPETTLEMESRMVHLATELASTPIGHPAPETASPPARHTPGPWFMSGVRFRMNGGEWHNILRYDEAKKLDEHIACVSYDPRNGAGLADGRLIAAAPELLRCLQQLHDDIAEYARINNLGGYDNHVMRQARSAMALARGEAQTVSDDRPASAADSVAR